MQAIVEDGPSFNTLKIRLIYDNEVTSLNFKAVITPPIGIYGLRYLESWKALASGVVTRLEVEELPIMDQTETTVFFTPFESKFDMKFRVGLRKDLCTAAFQQIVDKLSQFFKDTPTSDQLKNDPVLLLKEITRQSYDSRMMHKNIEYLLNSWK